MRADQCASSIACAPISATCARAPAAGAHELVARYNQQCVTQPAQRNGGGGLFDALFGNHDNRRRQRHVHAGRDGRAADAGRPARQSPGGGARGLARGLRQKPATAASSRSPIRRAAAGSTTSTRCATRCARNADVSVFTYPAGRRNRTGGIADRAALHGQPQRAEIPLELRFHLHLPPARPELGGSARRRRGAARPGEQGRHHRHAAEIARAFARRRRIRRPPPRPIRKRRTAKNAKATPAPTPTPTVAPAAAGGTDINGVDTDAERRRPRPSATRRPASPAASTCPAQPVAKDQGQTVEEAGPDGVKRRVRIIDPAL